MSVIKVNGLLNYNSASHWLTTTPLLKDKRAILYLTANDWEGKNFQDCLIVWNRWQPRFQNISSWSAAAGSASLAIWQLQTRSSLCLIADQAVLTADLPKLEIFNRKKLPLAVGQVITKSELLTKLSQLGFEPNQQVNKHLELAQRGQIIDLGLGSRLLRLELLGNSIDSLQWLDLVSQVPLEMIDEIQLPDFTITSGGGRLTDYLTADILVISQTDHRLPDQLLLTAFDQSAAEQHYQTWPDLQPQHWTDNWTKLKQLSGWTSYWLTRQPAAARRLVKVQRLPVKILQLPPGNLQYPPGWQTPSAQLLVLNDSYLLPPEIKQSRRRHFYFDLKPGDYVVHRDHGIGRLSAVTKLDFQGWPREYLIIDYAAQDKIYLPTDQADKISKYLGSGSPKLARLSNDAAWLKSLKKVKKETWELALNILNNEAQRRLQTIAPLLPRPDEQSLADDFAYEETPSQLQVLTDLFADLEQDFATDRLICGDVGFGKTELALRAAFRAVLNGGQVALICPTTILVQQHLDTFQNRLQKFGLTVGLLSRWQSDAAQTEVIKKLAAGQLDIVIATHRLLGRDIKFNNLRLVIIDEEQNFGVAAKEKLRNLSQGVHLISLSATPIPRTLHLALAGLKNISLLTEAPAGRQPIQTQVLPQTDDLIVAAVAQEVQRGGQVYYLHNRVETIEPAAQHLKKLLPAVRFGIAHGQLDDQQLASTMHQFDQGQLDVLVCSTIIANGLDLPNVNTLIVTNATRFGLSQLHQLRGRIGRGARQAYAYFLHGEGRLSGTALERLKTLQQETALGAGFRIASRDLELRGLGQLLGRRQHGHIQSIGLELYQELIEQAIANLQGRGLTVWRSVDIELPLATTPPDNYFSGLSERLQFWQQLALIRDLDELADFETDIKSASVEISNICYLQRLRILVQDTAVQKISYRRTTDGQANWLELSLPELPSQLSDKLSAVGWRWSLGKLKIRDDQLPDWPAELLKLITELKEQPV